MGMLLVISLFLSGSVNLSGNIQRHGNSVIAAKIRNLTLRSWDGYKRSTFNMSRLAIKKRRSDTSLFCALCPSIQSFDSVIELQSTSRFANYLDHSVLLDSACQNFYQSHDGETLMDVEMTAVSVSKTCLGAERSLSYYQSITFSNCHFERCTAKGNQKEYYNGGVLCLVAMGTAGARIVNCIFIQCQARNSGGAIYAEGGNFVEIKTCRFEKCESAIDPIIGKGAPLPFGAACCIAGVASLDISFSAFDENKCHEKVLPGILFVDSTDTIKMAHVHFTNSIYPADTFASCKSVYAEALCQRGDIQLHITESSQSNFYLNDVCVLVSKLAVGGTAYGLVLRVDAKNVISKCFLDKCLFGNQQQQAIWQQLPNRIESSMGITYEALLCPTIPFTASVGFSPSKSLSPSNKFVSTTRLSQSSVFPPTKPFSRSLSFSLTTRFSSTARFSLTGRFSTSRLLVASARFRSTQGFTISFSEPSSTETLTMSAPPSIIVQRKRRELNIGEIIAIVLATLLVTALIVVALNRALRKRPRAFIPADNDPIPEGMGQMAIPEMPSWRS
jgi:hypothetical protein